MSREVVVKRRPRRTQLNLSAVTLCRKLTEAGGKYFGGRARCCGVMRSAGVERVNQPRPCYFGQKRVEANLRFEGRLSETDHAESAAPGLGLIFVIKQNKATSAEVRVAAVTSWRYVGRESNGVGGQTRRGGNFCNDEFGPSARSAHCFECGMELRREGWR